MPPIGFAFTEIRCVLKVFGPCLPRTIIVLPFCAWTPCLTTGGLAWILNFALGGLTLKGGNLTNPVSGLLLPFGLSATGPVLAAAFLEAISKALNLSGLTLKCLGPPRFKG